MTSTHYPLAKRLNVVCFALALLVTLVGCKVGPNYVPPAAPVPETWSQELPENEADGVQIVPQNELIDTSWWTVFQDELLNQLVFEAANTNLDLRQTGVRILEARAQRAMVQGNLFPTVDAKASYTRNQISTNGNPFGFSGGSVPGFGGFKPFDLFSTGFDASWELDLFGQLRRAVEAADAEVGVSVEDHRGVAVSLFADVAMNYIDLRTLQEQIQIANENARVQQDTLRLVQDKFRVGTTTMLEVWQSTSILRNTQSNIPALRSQIRAAMNRLCVLRAQLPRDLEPELGTAPIPKAPPEVLLSLPICVVRQRPDVRRAERSVAAQCARVGVAVADLYPDISLTGTFTVDSIDFGKLFSGDSIAYRLTGPAIRWKILYFGRIRNNIRVQDARLEQAMLQYENAVLRSFEEVENALTGYVETKQRLAYLDQASDAAMKAEELARTRWNEGAESFQTVLDAQRSRLLIEELRTNSRGNVARQLISLYRALGGGWLYQPFNTMAIPPDMPADAAGERPAEAIRAPEPAESDAPAPPAP